jgi:hypothetical protein
MGNLNKLVSVTAVLLGFLAIGRPSAIAQSQPGPAWEKLSGKVILGTPGGDDMVVRLECYGKGGLVMLIPTSMDHSSGAIYLTNRDLKSEPYK